MTAPLSNNSAPSTATAGERFIQWAISDPLVAVLAQIGSRSRPQTGLAPSDSFSDWDFQVVTPHPAAFNDRKLLEQAGVGTAKAFVARTGRLGSAHKITALFDDGELDIVVIPLEQMAAVQGLVKAGRHLENPQIVRALEDMSLVLLGGYRILKGDAGATEIYKFVATKIPVPRLTDDDVRQTAEGFVCDYAATCRLLARGELLAAQRWLHLQLAEANFRLLHELRRRNGVASFPDARRIESLKAGIWGAAVAVAAAPEVSPLRGAVEKAGQTCRVLVHALVGTAWRWPDIRSDLSPPS